MSSDYAFFVSIYKDYRGVLRIFAFCNRTDECDYMKRAKYSEANERMIKAQMRGHGNGHTKDPRRTKAEMKKALGENYIVIGRNE